MEPIPEAIETGRKRLTFLQAAAHIGGVERLISEDGRRLIALNAREFIWKYTGHGFCTACGADVGDMKARHGARVNCPACGREVEFRHEARGHRRVFDQFVLYEWRRSILDPEAIALTAAHVWRDSTHIAPESEPLRIHASALYLFRPGRGVTVYKNHCWNDKENRCWDSVSSVHPDHTGYGGGGIEVVEDFCGFRQAVEGTRIGRLFDLLNGYSNRRDLTEVIGIANCARRPWLEYLAKCGQGKLAAALMRMPRIPRDVIPNPRARNPRALLGLTEAQWHETRRDGIDITQEMLTALSMLRRMGLGDMRMAEVRALFCQGDWGVNYHLELIAPSDRRQRLRGMDTMGDVMNAVGVPEKLKRKAYRRAIKDLQHASERRDYYEQLRRLNEDLTDTALLLPKDLHGMHQRMIERENALRAEAMRREAEALKEGFAARLEKLKAKYCFSACGLVLRPYESAGEVVEEGTALKICIGSYAKRYMEGGTIICALRRAEAPETPWRAVEFSTATGAMVQDRGYKNDTAGAIPEADARKLKEFWAAWRECEKQRRKTA